MKSKLWVKYFVYISLIFIIVFVEGNFLKVVKNNYYRGYNPFIAMFAFYVVLGVVLGLKRLILERKKEGKWEINLPKLLIIGVPSLYFSLAIFIYFNNYLAAFSFPIGVMGNSSSNFMSVFQLILGYTIITSFSKTNTKI